MAVRLTVSKISRVQRSERSCRNEIDYNPLKCHLELYILLNLNVC